MSYVVCKPKIGAYGGLQGGAFNYVNSHLSLWRFTYVPVSKPWRRFFEVLILSTVVSASTFGVSYLYASCKPRPSPDSAEPYISDLVSFYCSNSDYNELASLFMVSSENAIKQLFHSKSTFRLGHLAVFYLVYTILSCLTYGAFDCAQSLEMLFCHPHTVQASRLPRVCLFHRYSQDLRWGDSSVNALSCAASASMLGRSR